MRITRDSSGNLCFSPEEWRTAKQISSFFSRFAAAQRKKQATELTLQAVESIENDENDIEAWETEMQLQEMQKAVFNEIDFEHPIEYNGNNICHLVKEGKLAKKFKVIELKQMCEFLEIDVSGLIGRKNSYVKPLEVLVQSCSCSIDL